MKKQIAELSKLRNELVAVVNNYPQAQREMVIFDKWSLKDVLAHLAGWDEIAISAINTLIKGQTSEWGLSVDAQNKESVQLRQTKIWPEVYTEFVTKSQELIETYSKLSDDLWDQPLYCGKKFSPLKFLKTDIRHYSEHLDKVKRLL